jgi:hypothetical protein
MPTYFATTVGMKLDISVVMAAAMAGQQTVANHSLKALGPEFGLPPDCSSGCDESNKTDVAADQGPTQCLTGSDGTCSLDLAALPVGSFGSAYMTSPNQDVMVSGKTFPVGGPITYQESMQLPSTGAYDPSALVLDGTPQVSNLVVVAGGLNGCPFSQAVCDQVTDQVQIGDNTHYTVGCPESQQAATLNALGQNPNVLYSEPNYCGEKKLPPPRQYSVPVAPARVFDTTGRIGHAKIAVSFDGAQTGG